MSYLEINNNNEKKAKYTFSSGVKHVMGLPKDKPIKLVCLKCEKPFFSVSKINRLCDSCRKVNNNIALD